MLDEPTSEVPVIRPAGLADRDASDRGAGWDRGQEADRDSDPDPAAEPVAAAEGSTGEPAGAQPDADPDADPGAGLDAGPGVEEFSAADTPDETADSADAAAADHLDDPGAEPTLLLRPAPADRAHTDYDNDRDDHDDPTAASAAAPTENETENPVQIPDATHILDAPPQPAATPPVTAPFGAPSQRFGEAATSGQSAGAEATGAEATGAEATADAATDDWAGDAGEAADTADAGEVGDVGPPQTVAGNGSRAPGDVAETPIAVWSDESADRLREQWRELQGQFIDDPVDAVSAAKALVTGAVQELANTLLEAQDELDPFRAGEVVDTEAMRVAMRRYREFLDRVLAL
jgi:hypothetical protein